MTAPAPAPFELETPYDDNPIPTGPNGPSNHNHKPGEKRLQRGARMNPKDAGTDRDTRAIIARFVAPSASNPYHTPFWMSTRVTDTMRRHQEAHMTWFLEHTHSQQYVRPSGISSSHPILPAPYAGVSSRLVAVSKIQSAATPLMIVLGTYAAPNTVDVLLIPEYGTERDTGIPDSILERYRIFRRAISLTISGRSHMVSGAALRKADYQPGPFTGHIVRPYPHIDEVFSAPVTPKTGLRYTEDNRLLVFRFEPEQPQPTDVEDQKID